MSTFRETVQARLDSVEDLPTLPTVFMELERALQDEDSDATAIGKIIEEDPSMTGSVLRVANSATYGSSASEIVSVKDAVARLGMQEVRRLCTSLSVVRLTSGLGEHLDHKRFCEHSLVAGVTTGVIARFSSARDAYCQDEAYLAGLLHDIGVLILDQYFPAEFGQVRAVGDEKGLPYDEAERLILKMDHGEIGGMLMGRWTLPPAVVEAVTWHHQPGMASAESRKLVQAVHLAEFVCTCLGIGDGGDGGVGESSESAWHDLGLSVDDMPSIIDEVKGQVERCSLVISLGQ